jgi:hypothetical protein
MLGIRRPLSRLRARSREIRGPPLSKKTAVLRVRFYEISRAVKSKAQDTLAQANFAIRRLTVSETCYDPLSLSPFRFSEIATPATILGQMETREVA